MLQFKCQRPSMFLLMLLCAGAKNTASSFQPPALSARTTSYSHTTTTSPSFQLLASKGDNENLSAAGKERRDEDQRRKTRKADVVIGKTSAISGEKDFLLNPQSTEQEWLKHASSSEQQISRQTEIGMEMLKMLRLEESVEAFDIVFSLKPNAYCWQAGIAKYYLGDLLGAAKIFAQSAYIYESRFGQPASEERIWRDACELKYMTSLNRRQKGDLKANGGIKELVAQVVVDPDSETPVEHRKVIRIAKELFEASTADDSASLVLSRAKLRAICGTFESKPTVDRKMWKLNSWFYLGLHYDALGAFEDSKECIKMALRLCPTSKGDDIVHTLPLLHMSKRDWFDDDEYEESDGNATGPQVQVSDELLIKLPLGVTADPVIVKSLQDSISKLKFQEVKTALKNRGLPHTGAKEELQSRLFNSLVVDEGFS